MTFDPQLLGSSEVPGSLRHRANLSIVYVVTNPAMPGLVKIGKTGHDDANLRISQLYMSKPSISPSLPIV